MHQEPGHPELDLLVAERHVLIRHRNEAGLDHRLTNAAPVGPRQLLVLASPGAHQVPSLVAAVAELLRSMPDFPGEVETVWLAVRGLAADTEAAQRLAKELDTEIIAPDGGVATMPGAALYAGHSVGGTGWHQFRPDRPAEFHGARFPLPEWESWLPATPVEVGDVVAVPTPCGLMVCDRRAAAGEFGDLAFGVPVNPRFPKLVVGGSGPVPSPAAVAALLGGLPEQPIMVVPTTPEPASPTWQAELARRLSRDVLFSAGLQVALPTGKSSTVVPDAEGNPLFRPFPVVLRQPADGGDQQVIDIAAAPPGWVRDGLRSYRLAEGTDEVIADVVPSGLVLRYADGALAYPDTDATATATAEADADPADPDADATADPADPDADPDDPGAADPAGPAADPAVETAPFDPAGWTLTLGIPGQVVGLPVLAAAESLLAVLPPEQHAAIRVRMAGALDAEAGHALGHGTPDPQREPAPPVSVGQGDVSESDSPPVTGPVSPPVSPVSTPRPSSPTEPNRLPERNSPLGPDGLSERDRRLVPDGLSEWDRRLVPDGLSERDRPLVPDGLPERDRPPAAGTVVPPSSSMPPIMTTSSAPVSTVSGPPTRQPERAADPGESGKARRETPPAEPKHPPAAPPLPPESTPLPPAAETASPPSVETASPRSVEAASQPLVETASPRSVEAASPPLVETVSPPLVETVSPVETESPRSVETVSPRSVETASPVPPAGPAVRPLAVPVRPSTTAEQTRFTAAAGESFGEALATVNAALATWPSMRADESPGTKADYVAVCLYLGRGEGGAHAINGALRTGQGGALDGQVPCLMSGIRRLPTHRRAVLRQGKVNESLEHRSTPGTVLTEPGFLAASVDLDVTMPGADLDVLIWPTSARRTSELMLSRPIDEAVFIAGARFKALAVRTADRDDQDEQEQDGEAPAAPKVAVLFRELAPGEAPNPTELDERDLAVLAKLDNVLARRQKGPLRLVEDPEAVRRLTTSMVAWRDEAADADRTTAVAS